MGASDAKQSVRVPPSLALVALLLPSVATAGENDFRLNATSNGEGVLFSRIADGGATPRYAPDNALFRGLVRELGYVFSPRLASPAETLGHAGFHVSALWSGTFVSADERFWEVTERGRKSGDPSPLLQTLQLDVRKGLPFSFELGVNFMWLVDSELFAPGLELRWALQEGYKYIPDLGIRGSVNHMIGNRDLLLTTVGLDVVLSKSFGVGGMVNLAPYVSWSLLMIAANSRVIDPTPATELVDSSTPGSPVTRGDIQNNFVFDTVSVGSDVNHKLTVGLRMLVYILNVSVQGEAQMLGDDGAIGPVATISTKLGLDF